MTPSNEEMVADLLIHLAVLIVFIAVAAWPAKQLWNGFAPDLFGLPEATYLNGVAFLGFLVVSGVSPLKGK